MRYKTHTRRIATALAAAAIAAPAVPAADHQQPLGDGGGSSPGGPAYGIVGADEATKAGGGSSSGGPAFGIVPQGLALTGGGQSSGGPAYGVPVLQGPAAVAAPAAARGFDWADAGVGAGMGIAALLLAAAAAGVVRSRGKLAHS